MKKVISMNCGNSTIDEGYIHQFQPERSSRSTAEEHLSNDHEGGVEPWGWGFWERGG